jgi:hypothetical protein
MIARPADMFDRQAEWEALCRFVSGRQPGPALGLVSGRRRQGKTFLLQALCEATGGFYYQAIEATEREALQHLGQRVAAHLGSPGRIAFSDWEAALAALFNLRKNKGPIPVVIDEFPYLVRANASLPSVLQSVLAPRSARRSPAPIRLLLCGSAVAFMGKLLAGDAPLRGRAGLELIVSSFDYRQAGEFWGLRQQPELAFRVHAIVGGTPAYRREFINHDVPEGLRDFDDWVARCVLNPAVPLFREGRYLLAEEPDLRDTALYHSVLAAIAEGHSSRGAIAAALGRSSTDVGHPLAVLEDVGLIARSADAFRRSRPFFRIREPIVRFYHAIMRPAWGQLQLPGRGRAVWAGVQPAFSAALLGPHFEDVAREWTLRYATDVLDEPAAEVAAGVLSDRPGRTAHQVDVVALAGQTKRGRRRVLLLGEAKVGQTLDVPDLRRLQHIRDLAERSYGVDVSRCRLACFSGKGFTKALRAEARAGRALLIGFEDLYGGS